MDSIVYLVKSLGGGIDGRDHTDKGGQILHATPDKDAAESLRNGWSCVEPTVQDLEVIAKRVLNNLNALETLALFDNYHLLRGDPK
jgi:hypothetical protein